MAFLEHTAKVEKNYKICPNLL